MELGGGRGADAHDFRGWLDPEEGRAANPEECRLAGVREAQLARHSLLRLAARYAFALPAG